MYNWQQKDWTEFTYQITAFEDQLYLFTEKIGRVTAFIKSLPETTHTQAIIDTLVAEAIKTSAIEGEFLSREDVMSSIKNNLGLAVNKDIKDVRAKGIGNLVTNVQQTYQEPLNKQMLFEWHTMLFPQRTNINIGTWRSHSEPMQVVSGTHGREKIHFEAPPSSSIPLEMKKFIDWFNCFDINEAKKIRFAPIHTAISHLYFETIHPFEDGNGRIGRAIAEKALLTQIGSPLLISLSATIESDKKAYYEALQMGQQQNEITEWIIYFIDVILKSLDDTERYIDFILKKTRLFDTYKNQLNERQEKAIKRMLDEGPKGFEGGMNAKKYMSITKASKATATRDLQYLLKIGMLKVLGAGRSTSYEIVFL
jgi:Fic family protein